MGDKSALGNLGFARNTEMSSQGSMVYVAAIKLPGVGDALAPHIPGDCFRMKGTL